jgi:group I intron endonuclease
METQEISIIYMARCTLKKNLIYIGKSHQISLESRIEQHKQQARSGDSTPFHQALIDEGLNNWEWSIIETCDAKDEYEREEKYITQFGAAPIDLLNVTHIRKTRNLRNKKYSIKILQKNKGNRIIPSGKSELGKLFARTSGQLKPVINLKTNRRYESALETARNENKSISTIRICCSSGKMLDDGTRYAYLNLDNEPDLKEGHSKEHYLGKRETRAVKNLINGKVYKSIHDAAKEYDISKSCVDGVARGKYLTVRGRWVFCYLDENGLEMINERHKKGIEKVKNKDSIKYVAWHIDDQNITSPRYYKNLDELCSKLNIKNKGHVRAVCEGRRSHVEKWRIAFYDQNTEKPNLYESHNKAPKKVIRKVVCLNDKKEFSCGLEAGRFYGINASQITKCAGGGAKSVYCDKKRLRFAFLDDDGNPIIKEAHKQPLTWRGKKRIQRISTGEVFNSLAEYIRATNIPYKRAKKYLKDPNVDLLGYEFIELD